MTIENKLEFALKNRLRFPYNNGSGGITLEDLFTLDMEDLDEMFKILNRQMKSSDEESLLDKKTVEDEILAVKVEIIRHIVETKIADVTKANESIKVANHNQKIYGLIAKKKEEKYENMTIEELENQIIEE